MSHLARSPVPETNLEIDAPGEGLDKTFGNDDLGYGQPSSSLLLRNGSRKSTNLSIGSGGILKQEAGGTREMSMSAFETTEPKNSFPSSDHVSLHPNSQADSLTLTVARDKSTQKRELLLSGLQLQLQGIQDRSQVKSVMKRIERTKIYEETNKTERRFDGVNTETLRKMLQENAEEAGAMDKSCTGSVANESRRKSILGGSQHQRRRRSTLKSTIAKKSFINTASHSASNLATLAESSQGLAIDEVITVNGPGYKAEDAMSRGTYDLEDDSSEIIEQYILGLNANNIQLRDNVTTIKSQNLAIEQLATRMKLVRSTNYLEKKTTELALRITDMTSRKLLLEQQTGELERIHGLYGKLAGQMGSLWQFTKRTSEREKRINVNLLSIKMGAGVESFRNLSPSQAGLKPE